jgi:hypothetical protein
LGSFLAGLLLTGLQLVLHRILKFTLFLTGRLWFLLLRLFWPGWILVLVLGWCFASAESAHAGWFSWLWGDSEKAAQQEAIYRLETANHALQSAAEVVNESSRQQADQNVQLLSAIQTLSNERTELAGYLERILAFSSRDSQWAAALNLAAPVLLAVSVLLVAAVALWITHGSQPDDDATAVLDVLLLEDLQHEARQGTSGHITIGPHEPAVPNRPRGPQGYSPGSVPRRLSHRTGTHSDHSRRKEIGP